MSIFVDIKYARKYKIFIPKLTKYPRGVNVPLTDGLGKVLPDDQQILSVTQKEANSLVNEQKLFSLVPVVKKPMVRKTVEEHKEGGDN